MAIRKASEVAREALGPCSCSDGFRGRRPDPSCALCQSGEYAAEQITADRLAIVERLQQVAIQDRGILRVTLSAYDAAELVKAEIHAAAASKGTNDE